MESFFRSPEPLLLDGNISENWKRFEQKFNVFLEATGLKDSPEPKKIAVFLNLVGDDGLELHNSFTYSEAESKSLSMIMLKFSDYCSPKTNEIFERYKFNSIYQKEGQAFDSFLTDLRKAVKTTGYKEQNEMIRDRIVMGIHDKTTQERLLRESKLTLTKAIEFCRTVEVSKQQSKTLQEGGADVHLDAVKHKKPNMCKYCGYKHDFKKKCPAFGKTCASCQGRNHFASVCKSRTKNHNNKGDEGSSRKKKVDELQKQNDEPDKDGTDADSSEFYVDSVKSIGAVGANVREQTVWKKKLIVEDKEIEFKLDTGAEAFILLLGISAALAGEKKTTKRGVFGESVALGVGSALGGGSIISSNSLDSHALLSSGLSSGLSLDGGLNSISLGSGLSGLSGLSGVSGISGLSSGAILSSGGAAVISQPSISLGQNTHTTITRNIGVPIPQPYPVTVTRNVPVPVPHAVPVPVDRPYPVHVPRPYPVHVDRPVPYPVDKPVPYPVKVAVKVPVPHPVPYPVDRPYPVPVYKKVAVPVPHPVYIKKQVPVVVKTITEPLNYGYGW